jgi:glycosyltransferase involved in cell wall biosynthesis
LKIAIVSNSLSGGGAERSMNTLANELVTNNYDVTQIALNHSPQDTVENLASIIQIEREWKAGIVSTVYRFLKFNFYLLQLKPKILILNCELAELYGAFSLFTEKIVAVEHTNRPWDGRKKIGFLVRWTLHARRVKWVKVSSFLPIWPHRNNAATTIENPITRSQKRRSSENNRIDYLVYVGRITRQKGANLLPTIAKLTKKKLILLGDGELLIPILGECHDKKVDVVSHGFVKDPWKLIPPNSLLIIPSLWEGDGLVVVEAVLSNVPFLISDIPEFRRFNFSENNYCSRLDDFVKSISKFEGNLESLEIPSGIAVELENSRNPVYVSKQWINFLESVT